MSVSASWLRLLRQARPHRVGELRKIAEAGEQLMLRLGYQWVRRPGPGRPGCGGHHEDRSKRWPLHGHSIAKYAHRRRREILDNPTEEEKAARASPAQHEK